MYAYIFDIDGVISDIHQRRITHPELTQRIISLLQNHTVALISGRGLQWIQERITSKFLEYIQSKNLNESLLDNLYVSGEFGGCQMVFKHGKPQKIVNANIRLDSDLIIRATEISNRFSDIVFIDQEKQTQFTVEMLQNITIDQFAKKENGMALAYQKIVDELKLSSIIEVNQDRIGINIRYKILNKLFATKKFLDWMKSMNFLIDKFKVFGDSPSDLEIGDELKKRGLSFDFIYVGNPADIKREMEFEPIFTTKNFDKGLSEGTLEYLKSE